MKNIQLFDYCISNPPYQDQTKDSRPIFQHFQKLSNTISESSTMIYMASRWWYGTQGLDKFRKLMFDNKKLKKVVYYNIKESSRDIFDGTGISGGISIVTFSKENNDNFELVENLTGQSAIMEHDTEKVYPLKASFVNIAKKIRQTVIDKNLQMIYDRNELKVNGIDLDSWQIKLLNPVLIGKNNEHLNKINEIAENFNPDNPNRNRFKLYANVSGSKNGTSDYYLVDTFSKYVPNKNYKICIGQSIIENEIRPLRIFQFDKETEFGRSAVSLVHLNTQEESDNFIKYASTKFFEFCLRLTLAGRMKALANFVPDLKNYSTKDSLIDWSKSIEEINEDLYDLFNIDKDDERIIDESLKKR